MNQLLYYLLNPILFIALIGLIGSMKRPIGSYDNDKNGTVKIIAILIILLYFLAGIYGVTQSEI